MARKSSASRGVAYVIIAVVLALILGLGVATNWKYSGIGPSGPGAGGAIACEVFSTVTGQAGVTLTSVTATYYVPGASPLAPIVNAQALSVGTKTDAGVSLAPPFVAQYTSSNNYQFWATIPAPNPNGALTPIAGLPTGATGTVQYTTAPGGASYACVYQITVQLPAVPASCASATTNCRAQLIFPGAAPTAYNGITQALWTITANVFTSGGTAGQTVLNSYGICATSLANLPPGSSCPTSIGLYAVIYVNASDAVITSSATNFQKLFVSTSGVGVWYGQMMSTGGLVNTVSGVCAAGYTTNTNPCVTDQLSFTITTGSSSSGHTLVSAWIYGEQLNSYLTQPGIISVPAAATSLVASTGGTAGTPTGFSGVTPTSGAYSAVPAILFNQYVTTAVLTGS